MEYSKLKVFDEMFCGKKDHLNYWNSVFKQCSVSNGPEINYHMFNTVLETASDSLFTCDCVFVDIFEEVVYKGQVEIFEVLCARGVDLNAKRYGYRISSLHVMAEYLHKNIPQFLAAAHRFGANFNIQDRQGHSVVQYPSNQNRPFLVQRTVGTFRSCT